MAVAADNEKPWLSRRGRKVDYARRDALNRRLGILGERFTVEVERRRLREAGRDDVEWVAESRGVRCLLLRRDRRGRAALLRHWAESSWEIETILKWIFITEISRMSGQRDLDRMPAAGYATLSVPYIQSVARSMSTGSGRRKFQGQR
jgi:hypothetical protein